MPPLPLTLLPQPNVTPDLHLCPPLMHVSIAMIVGGRASANTGGGTGGRAAGCPLFCGLIRVDGEQGHQPRALSNPSPEGLEDVFGFGKEWPIAINSADVDADLVTKV
jgi:hypothetical protein